MEAAGGAELLFQSIVSKSPLNLTSLPRSTKLAISRHAETPNYREALLVLYAAALGHGERFQLPLIIGGVACGLFTVTQRGATYNNTHGIY